MIYEYRVCVVLLRIYIIVRTVAKFNSCSRRSFSEAAPCARRNQSVMISFFLYLKFHPIDDVEKEDVKHSLEKNEMSFV